MIRFAGESPEEQPQQPENPDVLFMPEDPTGEIEKRLVRKAAEYRARLSEWSEKSEEERDAYAQTQLTQFDPYLDSLYKSMIVDRLLDDNSVDLNQIRDEIFERERALNTVIFENAWLVIKKYITGAGGVGGGTGF